MKFAAKVIFLVRDPDGFGPAIFNSLIPRSDSYLTKSESTFELSLANCGVNDQKASGDLINFLDPQGASQVSIILLQNYGPPIAACAVREVLSSINSENLFGQHTIILPFITKVLKFNGEGMNLSSSKQVVALHAANIGATNDFSREIMSKIATISSSLQLNCESLACLVHMVRVLGVPTVLLVASDGQCQNKRTGDYELEALCNVGAAASTALFAAAVPIKIGRRGSLRIVAVRASASVEKSSGSSAGGGGGGCNGGKKGVPNNSKYMVPLDKATSGLTRPLAEILRDLNKRVPDNIINHHDNSIPWYHANRMLSFYAPGWCGEIRDVIYTDNTSVTVLYRLTIRGSDGEAHRESTGTASLNDIRFEDPVAAAEELAFCRACARFGFGLYLHHEEEAQ